MKCELCNQKDAETAITLPSEKGEERELYVCRECANRERVRRQKKSQRTRKAGAAIDGVSISVSGVTSSDGNPPPIVEAIMNAFQGMVSDLEKQAGASSKVTKTPEDHELPCGRTEAAYRIGSRIHLEGLHLIGELEAVHRAFKALKMKLVGVEADGVRDAGHVYSVRYEGSSERAKRVVAALLREERNARVRLFEEMPRVFGDSLCRALAILKNCRLLSPGEFFDLLSPLRLAALENMLDGVDLAQINAMIAKVDLGSAEDRAAPEERDRVDAERADKVNRRFEDVVLNERGEEKFL